MLNHQLNSTSNFSESSGITAETGFIISVFSNDATLAPWLLEFVQLLRSPAAEISSGIALHLPAPERRTMTPELRRVYSRVGRLLTENRIAVWSGGWSGTAASLLTRDELVWEARWSLTNEDNTGLYQLLACTPSVFLPSGATPAQVEHLATTLNCTVAGGYSDAGHFHLFSAGSWYVASSMVIEPLRTGVPPGGHAADQTVPLLHLVIDRNTIGTFPRAQDLVDRIAPELATRLSGKAPRTSTPFTTTPRGKQPATIPCFSGPAVPALDPIDPGIAATIRRTTRMNHQRVSRVLHGLSPFTSRDRIPFETPPGIPGTASPHDFQGSTEGHLSMEEGGMTVRFAGGRLAGITLDQPRGPVQTVPRRALGYVRFSPPPGGPVPGGRARSDRTRYLETRQAAWYSGTRARMVEEEAILAPGDQSQEPIRLTTRGALSDQVPGLLLSYRLRIPPWTPPGPVEFSLFAIPLIRQSPDDACTIGIVDGEGAYRTITLPPGPGRWVIPAWLLRIPLSPDDRSSAGDLWLGSAEPGQRLVIPWTLTRSRSDRGLLLAVDGIHARSCTADGMPGGIQQTGTLILADGRHKATELLLGTGETTGVTPFASGFTPAQVSSAHNRSVPE